MPSNARWRLSAVSWLTLVVVGLTLGWGQNDADPDKVVGLLNLRRSSADAVIRFTPTLFQQYAAGRSRQYSIIFMLTARHLMDKPNLKQKKLRYEFGLAASAYREKYSEGGSAGHVFFAELEFKENQEVFQRLGVQSLPNVFRLAPSLQIRRSGAIEVPETERMSMEEFPDYPWSAETIAQFVAMKTGLRVETIPRKSVMQSRWFGLVAILTVCNGMGLLYKLYYTQWVRNSLIYLSGTLAICWFATSGGMFNIIRNIPFAIPTKDGRVQYFYPGHSQQLGAEGFVMGTLYLLFAGAFVAMTYGVPLLESKGARRGAFYTALVIACLAINQVIGNYQWKTGYRIRQYVF